MTPAFASFGAQAMHYFQRAHEAPLRRPLEVPAAWRGADMGARPEEWTVRLAAEDVAEIEAACGAVRARGLALGEVRREDFLLPRLAERVRGWTRELLSEAPGGALRVVALHHHLIGAPWRSRKQPVARRSHVLASLVDSGAELILAGHIHQGAVSERHEFEVIRGDARGAVVSIAPGLGQPRPRRRGEARGLHVYECDERSILVQTYIWRSDDWGLTAERRFGRGPKPLGVEA